MGSKTTGKGKVSADFYPTPTPLVKLGVNLAIHRCKKIHPHVRAAMDFPQTNPFTDFDPLSFLDPGCGPDARFARYAAKIGFGECVGVDIGGRGDFDPESCVHGGLDIEPPYAPLVYFGTDYLNTPPGGCGWRPEWVKPGYYDLVCGNPPFSLAEPFVRRSLEMVAPDGVVSLLLRLGFWESAARIPFFDEFPPAETHVLAQRPSFYTDTGIGKTDGTAYAWFLWDGQLVRRVARSLGYRPTIKMVSWR